MTRAEIIEGDALAVLRMMEAESVHAIVTDPPYGLKFMDKAWDRGIPGAPFWAESRRVAKPGAYLLAFGGTRTFHRLTCAIEDAGWEIRDCLCWLYGQGFPKSLDVSKAIDKAAGIVRARVPGGVGTDRGYSGGFVPGEAISGEAISGEAIQWQGWGTALKPAWEPIILARKRPTGTVAENVARHGCGALNIHGCRIEGGAQPLRISDPKPEANGPVYAGRREAGSGFDGGSKAAGSTPEGRWPANVVLDEEVAAMLDEQSGELASGLMKSGQLRSQGGGYRGGFPGEATKHDTPADSGGASRFFYCAKADRVERNEGLEGLRRVTGGEITGRAPGSPGAIASAYAGITETPRANFHPTVKPLLLMQWLMRLVTPPGGLVLDPFAGSGSTVLAAKRLGFDAVGIEIDPAYCALARERIRADAPLFAEPQP